MTTTDELKALIDSMVIDRIPAPDIADFIANHANGNTPELHTYLIERQSAMPEDYLTDAGNGEAVAAAWKHMARFVYEWKTWIVYHGGRWELDAAGITRKLAVKTMRKLYMDNAKTEDLKNKEKKSKWYIESENDKRVTAMLNHARTQPGMTARADHLDNKPWLLNLKNGTYDLDTCQLRAANPEDLLTKQIAIAYNPEAQSQEWDRFLLTIFDNDRELIDFIQRGVGYTLNGTQLERVVFVLYGLGRNGKSQLMDALRRTLGEYAYEAKPETFMERRYSSDGPDEGQAALKGVRLLTATEVKRGQSLNISLIKRMTGGEPIWHERKFQSGYSFYPTHTLWLSGNHEQQVKDSTDSIWDRIIKINFNVRISSENEIKGYGEKLAEKYPEAILNWCIQGAIAWRQAGLASRPESVKVATDEYRASQDVLHDFIEAKIRKEPGQSVTGKEVYEAYKKHCETEDIGTLSKVEFNEAMRERGYKDKRGHANKPTWMGVTLVTDVTEKQDSFLNTRAREESFPKTGKEVTEVTEVTLKCPECGDTELEYDSSGNGQMVCGNHHVFDAAWADKGKLI